MFCQHEILCTAMNVECLLSWNHWKREAKKCNMTARDIHLGFWWARQREQRKLARTLFLTSGCGCYYKVSLTISTVYHWDWQKHVSASNKVAFPLFLDTLLDIQLSRPPVEREYLPTSILRLISSTVGPEITEFHQFWIATNWTYISKLADHIRSTNTRDVR